MGGRGYHINEIIKNKKYEVVIENPKGDSRHRVYRIFYGTAREADEFAIQLKAEILKGTYIDPSKLTYGDYLLRWYNSHVKTLADTTQRRYKNIIELRLIPRLGGIRLEELRTIHIKDFYAQIIKDGKIVQVKKKGRAEKLELVPLSQGSLNYHHAVIHKSLNDAVEDELIRHNPAPRRPKLPQDPDDDDDDIEEKVHILEPDQVEIMLLRMDPLGWHHAIVFVAVWTGLRRSELLGLRWQDIDLAREMLSVRQAVAYTPERGIFVKKKLKNKKSRRTIDITPEVVDVLNTVRQKQSELKNLYGKEYDGRDLIFCQPDGKPMHPDTISSWFPDFLEKIIVHKKCGSFMQKEDHCSECDTDVPPDEVTRLPRLNFHCLRHTHASLMLLAGNTLEDVSARLGHSSIRVTYDIYSHLVPSAKKESMNRFRNLFKK